MNHRTLPIHACVEDIRAALEENPRLVLSAPTGSGKSTQVPQILLDRCGIEGQVVVLQPRRIAARMLAKRVAYEREVPLGSEVGYQVRFENHVGASTRIRYVTEGILLRQLVHHSDIEEVGAVIFDEFHERHLYGDITLSMIRCLQQTKRPDLKMVVMSATMDSHAVEDYLEPCRTITSEGRTYPVRINYLERSNDDRKNPVWNLAADAAARVLKSDLDGDLLVFMPGAYEIRKTVEALRGHRGVRDVDILPMHGQLPAAQQDQAVEQRGRRKIVVATNVAETSITIDGITTVIDSGLVRMARYDFRRGIDSLLIENISRASADQRSGRAGRTQPGQCFRLWTSAEQAGRALQQQPEIQRTDLAEAILSLKAFGVTDLSAFPWYEVPEEEVLNGTEAFLEDIGALNHKGVITDLGRRMLSFPVHPRYACMLLHAGQYDCVSEIALITALMQGRNLLIKRVDRKTEEMRNRLFGETEQSDLFRLIKAWWYAANNRFDLDACKQAGIHAGSARTAGQVYRRFLDVADNLGLSISEGGASEEAVRRCIMAGFMDRLARRMDQGTLRCVLVHGRRGELCRSSLLRDVKLLVAGEIIELEGARHQVRVQLSQVTAVEEAWLSEMFPNDLLEDEKVFWDVKARRVRRRRTRSFRDLALEEVVDDQVSAEDACVLLADEILHGRIKLSKWGADVDQWIERVNSLAAWCPEWNLPSIDSEAIRTIVETLCHGARTVRDLKDKSVIQAFKNWLSQAQMDLVKKYAPDRLELPSGRRAKVRYDQKNGAVVSATIQDLYGLEKSPRLANGKAVLRVEILAPNQRPVQITDDLSSFWTCHYPAIKKELQRKYYKHEWR